MMRARSGFRRVGRDFVDPDGLDPFRGDGVARFHRHRGVFVKHLRASPASPREKVQEVVFAQGLGTGWSVGSGFAIGNAAMNVVHGTPRFRTASMPIGALDFQGLPSY
jgi:hypothetical protein